MLSSQMTGPQHQNCARILTFLYAQVGLSPDLDDPGNHVLDNLILFGAAYSLPSLIPIPISLTLFFLRLFLLSFLYMLMSHAFLYIAVMRAVPFFLPLSPLVH